MPQDNPSINARDSDADGMSTNAATTKMPRAPIPTPIPAVRIGSPAAVTAPKVTSRIRNAAPMPMISGRWGTATL